jgi:putative SOS response-associated peptidase YedK
MFIDLNSKEPLAFAGLWKTWKKPDGNVLESFAI